MPRDWSVYPKKKKKSALHCLSAHLPINQSTNQLTTAHLPAYLPSRHLFTQPQACLFMVWFLQIWLSYQLFYQLCIMHDHICFITILVTNRVLSYLVSYHKISCTFVAKWLWSILRIKALRLVLHTRWIINMAPNAWLNMIELPKLYGWNMLEYTTLMKSVVCL